MIPMPRSNPHEGSLRDLAPDLTPMLDILFILLVFFMLTAGAVFQTLNLELPSAGKSEAALPRNAAQLVLEIRPRGYAINGEAIADFEALKLAMATAGGKKEVVVAADRGIAIERLLKVLVEARSSGFVTADILMKNED